MSDNLIALIVILGSILWFAIFYIIFSLCEKRAEILRKHSEYEELFKIKAFRKAFLKKYKYANKISNLKEYISYIEKEIEILNLEISVYKDKYLGIYDRPYLSRGNDTFLMCEKCYARNFDKRNKTNSQK